MPNVNKLDLRPRMSEHRLEAILGFDRLWLKFTDFYVAASKWLKSIVGAGTGTEYGNRAILSVPAVAAQSVLYGYPVRFLGGNSLTEFDLALSLHTVVGIVGTSNPGGDIAWFDVAKVIFRGSNARIGFRLRAKFVNSTSKWYYQWQVYNRYWSAGWLESASDIGPEYIVSISEFVCAILTLESKGASSFPAIANSFFNFENLTTTDIADDNGDANSILQLELAPAQPYAFQLAVTDLVFSRAYGACGYALE